MYLICDYWFSTCFSGNVAVAFSSSLIEGGGKVYFEIENSQIYFI